MFFSPALFAQEILRPFSDEECLNVDLDVKKEMKWNKWFIWKSSLAIKKDKCHIVLTLNKWPWKLNQEILIFDVCREPVHFKKGSEKSEIIKRNESSFIQEYRLFEEVFLNKVLVNAEGDKENLSSEHGQFYCSFLLFHNYLSKEKVFGRFFHINPEEGMIYQRLKELEQNGHPIKSLY